MAMSSSNDQAISMISNRQLYSETSLERIKKIISTLPIEDGWRDITPLFLYQGYWQYPFNLENIMLAQECFIAEPSDVYVCSFPKSGTTWLKALTFAIVTRTRFDFSSNPLLFTFPHFCMPNLDTCFTFPYRCRWEPGFPLIASHAPYDSLPKSVRDSDCKIVYICREPKDAFVSLFHFVAKSRPKEKEPISLKEAFELFCDGKSFLGPLWDHVLGYWKVSLEKPEKVLFLKYEEMMEDPRFHVKKMAEFMGYPFSAAEEEQEVVQKIVEMCSFEFLSNLEVNKHVETEKEMLQNNTFFRKGGIRDWINHLTPEMAQRMDKITEHKLSGSGLSFTSSSN